MGKYWSRNYQKVSSIIAKSIKKSFEEKGILFDLYLNLKMPILCRFFKKCVSIMYTYGSSDCNSFSIFSFLCFIYTFIVLLFTLLSYHNMINIMIKNTEFMTIKLEQLFIFSLTYYNSTKCITIWRDIRK